MGFRKGLDSGDPAAVTQGCRGLRNRPGMVWETPPRSPAKPSRPGEPVGGTSHGSVWLCAAADPSGRFAGAGAQPERAVQRRECPSARSQADGAAGSLLATAGAMRAAGLLLAWALLHPAATQQCHPASPGGVLRFTDRHAEIRVPALHRVPSSLDPLYGLVRRCLDLIQQNPLPTGEPRAGEPLLRGPGPRGVCWLQSPRPEPLQGSREAQEEDSASVPVPLPREGWGCIGCDQCHDFFMQSCSGQP